MRFFYSACSLAFIAATTWGCGSDVVVDKPGDSGATSGAGGSSSSGPAASSSASGSTASATTGGGGAPTDCEKVPEYLKNLYEAASACAPEDPSLHCMDIVDGYCCPVIVESVSSPATQAYLDFLHLTQKECPEMWKACEAVDCAFPESGTCVPDGSGQGHCATPQ